MKKNYTVEFCESEAKANMVSDYYYSTYSYYMKKKYGRPKPQFNEFKDGSSTWLVWHY